MASWIVILMMKVCRGNWNIIPYTGMYLPYDLYSHLLYSGISSHKKLMTSCNHACIGKDMAEIDPTFAGMHRV